MALNKPYVRKPLVHSSRDESILANIKCYLIQTPSGEARVGDPGQCVAALRTARARNLRCMVYAVGDVLGEEGLAFVDEDYLLKKIGGG
jgi:hypothetical protein